VAKLSAPCAPGHISETEIAAVHKEAERLQHQGGRDRPCGDQSWAELGARALPFSGTVLEKNVALGDVIDPSLNLFKIADCAGMQVLANVYEEDLSVLQSLPPTQRTWHKLASRAIRKRVPLTGTIEQIGQVIDPAQAHGDRDGWVDTATAGCAWGSS